MSILKVNTIQDKGGNTLLSSDGAGAISSGGAITNTPAWRVGITSQSIAYNTDTKLQYNRNWTWKDVRHWLVNFVGTADTNQFYTGVESISANDENWADVESLEGGNPFVIWDSLTDVTEELVLRGSGLKFSGIRVLYKT